MTATIQNQQCPECLSQEGRIFWRDLPMNEAIREYTQTYISPPVVYYFTMEDALAVWGQDFNAEDYP